MDWWKGFALGIATSVIGTIITPVVISLVVALLAALKKTPVYMLLTVTLVSLASTLVIADHIRNVLLAPPITSPSMAATSSKLPEQSALLAKLSNNKGVRTESPRRPPELKVYFGTSEAKNATFIVPLKDNVFSLPVMRIQNSGGSDAPSPRTRLSFSEPVDEPQPPQAGYGWQKVSGLTKGSEFYYGGLIVPPIGAGETWTGPEFAGKLLTTATEIDGTVSVFYGAEKPVKASFKIVTQRR